MGVIKILIGDQGEPVKLYFQHNDALDGIHYGRWATDTPYIELSTEAWEYFRNYTNDSLKLKAMMERLYKYEAIPKIELKATVIVPEPNSILKPCGRRRDLY